MYCHQIHDSFIGKKDNANDKYIVKGDYMIPYPRSATTKLLLLLIINRLPVSDIHDMNIISQSIAEGLRSNFPTLPILCELLSCSVWVREPTISFRLWTTVFWGDFHIASIYFFSINLLRENQNGWSEIGPNTRSTETLCYQTVYKNDHSFLYNIKQVIAVSLFLILKKKRQKKSENQNPFLNRTNKFPWPNMNVWKTLQNSCYHFETSP